MVKKAFITKYALTSGILEQELEVEEHPQYFKKYAHDKSMNRSYFNDEFHLTKEEAIKDAEKRRIKKIESLKKQILKLENLKF